MKVEFKGYAYKTQRCESVEEMLNGEQMPAISRWPDMAGSAYSGDWVKLGTATVIVEFDEKAVIVANQLEVLKAALHTVRAENQKRENAIIDQISKLTAIDYTPAPSDKLPL